MAMIADFGISNVVMTHASVQKNAGGTIKWMAPELLEDDDQWATVHSDIWSFACICYEVGTTSIHDIHCFPHFDVDLDRERAISRV
jgi:serine/threonine protein kinase